MPQTKLGTKKKAPKPARKHKRGAQTKKGGGVKKPKSGVLRTEMKLTKFIHRNIEERAAAKLAQTGARPRMVDVKRAAERGQAAMEEEKKPSKAQRRQANAQRRLEEAQAKLDDL